MKNVLGKFLMVGVAVAAIGMGSQAKAITQLGIAIDGSGSISGADFTLEINGIANALSALVPTDSSVEISVVLFSGGSALSVPPTLIDSGATLATVTGTISGLAQPFGGTNMSSAITALSNAMTGSANFAGGAADSLINIVTDGFPNNQAATQAAATAAAAAGIDGLSAEGVGGGAGLAFLAGIAFPVPGIIVLPNAIPNPLVQGFVVDVNNFAAFEAAFSSKIQQVVNVVPEPITATLGLMGMGVLASATRRRRAA